MRKLAVGCSVVSLLAAGFPAQPSFAQTQRTSLAALRADPVDRTPQIAEAIKSFPSGGSALRRHVSDLIVQDPAMASALAKYLLAPNDMSAAQKEAVEAGLADALNRLGIVARAGTNRITPVLLGLLAVGGIIGLVAIIGGNDKSSSVSPN